MVDPLVSVIIPNWNGGEVFKACLESLQKIKYPNWELIVVDNGSNDSSEKFISQIKLNCLRQELIKNEKNLGYAPANNQGLKIARGKYLLLLNNDTLVEPDLINILVEKAEKDLDVGVIQPKILIEGKKDILDNVGSFLTITGFLAHQGFLSEDSEFFQKEREIFSAKGACLLIRKSVVEKICLFDDDFGSYFEETDFCWRVWLLGYRIIYYPETFIYHKLGYSSKRQSQSFIFYHSNKNRLMSLIKNLELKNLILIGGYQILILMGLSIYYLVKLQFDRWWMIVKAITWNIYNFSKIWSKRVKVQKLRKQTDKDLFKKILVPFSIKDMIQHFGRVEANFK